MTVEDCLGPPAAEAACLCGRRVRLWRHDRIVVLSHPAPPCDSYLMLDDPEAFMAGLQGRQWTGSLDPRVPAKRHAEYFWMTEDIAAELEVNFAGRHVGFAPPRLEDFRPEKLVISTAEMARLAKAEKRIVAIGSDWVEYGPADEHEEDSDGGDS